MTSIFHVTCIAAWQNNRWFLIELKWVINAPCRCLVEEMLVDYSQHLATHGYTNKGDLYTYMVYLYAKNGHVHTCTYFQSEHIEHDVGVSRLIWSDDFEMINNRFNESCSSRTAWLVVWHNNNILDAPTSCSTCADWIYVQYMLIHAV